MTDRDRILDVLVVGAGQAGLATAYHLQQRKLSFLLLEATGHTVGSWRRYYDSLVLFSPARYSSLPGLAFPGPPDRYPAGPEVAAYLSDYAAHFQFPIRLNAPVIAMARTTDGFELECQDGQWFRSRTVVVATGSFAHPHIPVIPGHEEFEGHALHAIDYKNPDPFRERRVVVVGAGNTAVQIAYELASLARVTLATRKKIRFAPQRLLGKDLHWWLDHTGLDRSSLLSDQSTPVLDDGRYRSAIRSGKLHHRPMFSQFTKTGVIWPDGTAENIDAVIYATGYRSTADFLGPMGALDQNGLIAQRNGCSTRVPGLYFVGFSLQRNFASATLRGVGPDAEFVTQSIASRLQ